MFVAAREAIANQTRESSPAPTIDEIVRTTTFVSPAANFRGYVVVIHAEISGNSSG
jgi:hypothetical protein